MMMMQYVGCNRANTHYKALTMGARHQLHARGALAAFIMIPYSPLMACLTVP
jgi:hypothetical protein